MSRNSEIYPLFEGKTPDFTRKSTGRNPAKHLRKKTTGSSDICFLVEIASKTKKKDRNFDPIISYIYIAVDPYEFLHAEAHHVGNKKITRDV